MTALLEAEGVAITGRLQPTDLTLHAGSMTAVIGPNGSGKTSLLRAIAGVERAQGSIRLCGVGLQRLPAPQRRRLLSFLPASREVVWPIAAEDAIALGLDVPDQDRIDTLIEQLELTPIRHRAIDRLSTGERARVLLARALAPSPRLLLLDEPLSNLDPYFVLKTLDTLRSVAAAGAGALVSLHDLSLLPEFDRVILMHDGAIVAQGSADEVLKAPSFKQALRIVPTTAGWKVTG